jgi:hypothetical protein
MRRCFSCSDSQAFILIEAFLAASSAAASRRSALCFLVVVAAISAASSSVLRRCSLSSSAISAASSSVLLRCSLSSLVAASFAAASSRSALCFFAVVAAISAASSSVLLRCSLSSLVAASSAAASSSVLLRCSLSSLAALSVRWRRTRTTGSAEPSSSARPGARLTCFGIGGLCLRFDGAVKAQDNYMCKAHVTVCCVIALIAQDNYIHVQGIRDSVRTCTTATNYTLYASTSGAKGT